MSKPNVNDESTKNNANKMFLLSLLPDLNSMTSTQIRSFKRQVIDVIDNILHVPTTSSKQTPAPALVHIPNTSSILSSQTSPFVGPEIQHPSKSSSQVTTDIELPIETNNDIIEYTTDDGVNAATYIQLLQNTVGEVNYTQN
ncbi:unnamed protein product [Acanthoscelides obtectus]|uniref:BESS domain-containing protein n=1 Tax=Acanthoscelides obtectus TaxID=200917 RepID=A0A9P0LXM7_ACAOB|nr:unnamed protein product [Acanthoscelides obtectus]CAK1666781.1 hypothetical protein AOBTE_LOCUS25489 [Acanthoscelides obtectus]